MTNISAQSLGRDRGSLVTKERENVNLSFARRKRERKQIKL